MTMTTTRASAREPRRGLCPEQVERNSLSEQSFGEDTGDDTEESSRMTVIDPFINDVSIEVWEDSEHNFYFGNVRISNEVVGDHKRDITGPVHNA